ncbi:MAG: CoA-binding protein [Anaerolineales bacterium]|nr:MAG: CoA-binding protein [Anaerolineales bacterium]
MYDFLRKVPLFADLPDEDLDRLCQMVTEVRLQAGDELFAEGSPGNRAFVIQEGEIEILKSSGGRNVQIALRKPGEVIGEMSLLESAPRFASGRARTDSLLLAIGHEQLNNLLNTSPSAARAMLHTITARLRSTELVLRQSEKMAQLGTLTAGIAHELNNPAAAAGRGAQQLKTIFAQYQQASQDLYHRQFSPVQTEAIESLDSLVRSRAAKPADVDTLTRSDREEEAENWLEDLGIEEPWNYAPVMVNLGYPEEDIRSWLAKFQGEVLEAVLQWLEANLSTYTLLEEISQGASRIGEIVKSLKSYVYLDQAPVQEVDIHEGLDNTLVMLRSKLKTGINVRREYTKNLPRIQAYGSELNQVWTNLIDNAIDAMEGNGELILRTALENDNVIVEIQDNGPGIPQEIQTKLFSPFFTTKPVGKGTGLGLNISYNIIQKHAGEIKLYSRPGKTCFTVILPINFDAAKTGTATLVSRSKPKDEMLRNILDQNKHIAVVGISNRTEVPAHSVPAYLQQVGYRIYPVNPNLTEVLGEKAYPDLLALPDPVDVVLIFRRSEAVPPIVEQAIKIGAKVVWMQEGIVNEAAAETAREAGLEVVMDTCMRATHKRLMANTK